MDEELIRKFMDKYRNYDPGVLSAIKKRYAGEELDAIRRILAQHGPSPDSNSGGTPETPAQGTERHDASREIHRDTHPAAEIRARRGAIAKRPPFGVYLLSFTFPPGYFLLRKRPGAAIFSLVMFFISLPLYFVFLIPGFLLWFANAIWGAYSLRNEMMDVHIREQARAIADEMASQRDSG